MLKCISPPVCSSFYDWIHSIWLKEQTRQYPTWPSSPQPPGSWKVSFSILPTNDGGFKQPSLNWTWYGLFIYLKRLFFFLTAKPGNAQEADEIICLVCEQHVLQVSHSTLRHAGKRKRLDAPYTIRWVLSEGGTGLLEGHDSPILITGEYAHSWILPQLENSQDEWTCAFCRKNNCACSLTYSFNKLGFECLPYDRFYTRCWKYNSEWNG